jgi:hypothetical protein
MNKPAPMDVTQNTGSGAGAGAEARVELPERASLGRVLRDQKKIVLVALTLAVAAFWVCGQLDRWTLAGCIAGGVALGLANHLATELWLLRIITSGAQPTRNQMIASTLARLSVLTVVAVGFAIAFWPDGIGLLLGLAIFRLIALMMTSLVLLKELKSQ